MKKILMIVLAGALLASLAACGEANTPSDSGVPSGSEPSSSQGSSSALPQDSSALPQSGPDSSQGEPEEIDLDKMTEEYANAAQFTDRLSGKNVKITGYLSLDREKGELSLQGRHWESGTAINIVPKLSKEDDTLLKSEEFFSACVTLTGRIDEEMTKETKESGTVYNYTLSDAKYVTNICEVTGVLEKDRDGIYSIEGVGDIRFLNKDDIPPVGTQVTLSGKISRGGDFRDAVVVKK